MKSKVSFVLIFLVGVVLLFVGSNKEIPSKELSYYGYDDKTEIEEYVGGDAYNYIIGAALTGGEIAGVRAEKAIYTSIGALLAVLGLAGLVDKPKKETPTEIVNPYPYQQ